MNVGSSNLLGSLELWAMSSQEMVCRDDIRWEPAGQFVYIRLWCASTGRTDNIHG